MLEKHIDLSVSAFELTSGQGRSTHVDLLGKLDAVDDHLVVAIDECNVSVTLGMVNPIDGFLGKPQLAPLPG